MSGRSLRGVLLRWHSGSSLDKIWCVFILEEKHSRPSQQIREMGDSNEALWQLVGGKVLREALLMLQKKMVAIRTGSSSSSVAFHDAVRGQLPLRI